MWPWGHAAVGYLLYSGYGRARNGVTPDGMGTIALLVGTQFPDLVDKTFAWQFDLLPAGRSLGHSLVVAAVALAVLRAVARGTESGSLVAPFGVGYLSHLFGDGLYPLVGGEFYALGFLGYPVVPPLEYEFGVRGGFLAHLLALDLGIPGYAELGLALVATWLWYRDGMPGLRVLVPARFREASERAE